MAAWLKRAENLLNAVDTAVMKTVTNSAEGEELHALDGHINVDQKQDQGGFVYATTSSPFGVLDHTSPAKKETTIKPPANAAPTAASSPTTIQHTNNGSGGVPGTHDGSASFIPTASTAMADVPSMTSVHISPSSLTLVSQSTADINTTTMATPPHIDSSTTQVPLPPSMAVTGKRPVLAPLTAVTESGTGSNREQQLTRLVEQLKDRLRASKIEAEQLEDMLAQAEARCEREKVLLGQLQIEVTSMAESKALMEAALNAQLNQQALGLQEAQQRADMLSRQVLALEGQLAVATEANRNALQNRTDMEGGMLDALRSQLSAVESQLESERRAHSSTRAAAVTRERELEAAASGTMSALAEVQHNLQLSSSRIRDLEDALALSTAKQQALELQAISGSSGTNNAQATLQQELSRIQSELEVQRESWQQANTARATAQREVASLQAELKQLRLEMDQGTRKQDTSTLEASLREAHDLIYQKQATIERISADRAALQLRLEREVAVTARNKTEHQTLSVTGEHQRTALALTDGDQSLVPTTSVLGERYRRLASRGDNLGAALAALTSTVDTTASITAHLLRQYPIVRLIAMLYLLCIHLYVYWVTLRLQHAAVVLDLPDTASALGAAAGGTKT